MLGIRPHRLGVNAIVDPETTVAAALARVRRVPLLGEAREEHRPRRRHRLGPAASHRT